MFSLKGVLPTRGKEKKYSLFQHRLFNICFKLFAKVAVLHWPPFMWFFKIHLVLMTSVPNDRYNFNQQSSGVDMANDQLLPKKVNSKKKLKLPIITSVFHWCHCFKLPWCSCRRPSRHPGLLCSSLPSFRRHRPRGILLGLAWLHGLLLLLHLGHQRI